jgi:1-deoxy-D-xylulose-5-phosphate reductoisomerase
MRLPIQYACSYPERWEAPLPSLDIARAGRLEFSSPPLDRFPCLGLAYDALRAGGTLPVVLNAANEIAVELFVQGKLGFMAIPRVIKRTMDMHEVAAVSALEVVRRADSWARLQAQAAAGEVELNSVGRPN